MLIHHGYEKLDSIENFADAFVRPLHIPFPVTMSYLAAFSEIFGSWLLITGLGARFGALALMGTVSFGIYHAIMTSWQHGISTSLRHYAIPSLHQRTATSL